MKLRCKKEALYQGKKIMHFTEGEVYDFERSYDPPGWRVDDDYGTEAVFFDTSEMFEEITPHPMEQIKLEVGKTYEVRFPNKVKSEGHHTIDKIVEDRGTDYHFRYKSENGDVYSESGQYYRSAQSAYDLVREVKTT